MKIVSQDKKRIVNLKGECESFNIGNYEREERSEEVLQEIVRQYENSMWKLVRHVIFFQLFKKNLFIECQRTSL